MRALMAGRDGVALQLGVTPEIAVLPERSVAIDWNPEMIAIAWPGGGSWRRPVIGDWKMLPIRDHSVGIVFGDGSLTMLRWPDQYRLVLERLTAIVRPGGRAVLRCFATPDPCETIDVLCEEVWMGRIGTFPAFKLRFNMAVGLDAGDMNPHSDAIHRAFSARFPDREALGRATGWTPADIAEIDSYRGSAFIHSYPTRDGIMATLPATLRAARFVETEGYELAERCPLLVLDFA